MNEIINKYFEKIIRNLLPDLSDEEVKNRVENISDDAIKDFLQENNNPFMLLMLLICGYPDIINKIGSAIIEDFKNKTGIEATLEDIKSYKDIESEISTYKQIKEFLERENINQSDIPPILTLILSCKATFLIPIKGKINELKYKQKQIINKYKNEYRNK